MPASPSGPSSPPNTKWHEYKPAPSAFEVLDARFEAFVFEQSRLLGEAHRCLKGHEKHLQRQQKRLVRLEERVDELFLGKSLGVGEGEVREGRIGVIGVGVERQIGRFRVVEGVGSEGLSTGMDEAGGEGESGRKLPAPQIQLQDTSGPSWSDAKTDEEAWEESLGFGRATHKVVNADLRPQHEYRRPDSALAIDTKDSAHPPSADSSSAVAGSGGPQDIDRNRCESGHSPVSRVRPSAAGHSSMVEMLDQLGEELMGFERERDGFWKGKGKAE